MKLITTFILFAMIAYVKPSSNEQSLGSIKYNNGLLPNLHQQVNILGYRPPYVIFFNLNDYLIFQISQVLSWS